MQLKEDLSNMSNNGLEATVTTVQDLLEDDDFDEEKLMSQSVGWEIKDANYETCLEKYIKGEAKGCLEAMYSLNMLDKKKLVSSFDYMELMINACDKIHSFKKLGVSLQKVLKEIYFDTCFIQGIRQHGKEMFNLSIVTKYYRNSIKAYELLEKSDFTKLEDLKDVLLEDLTYFLKKRTNEGRRQYNTELLILVETYIMDIQVRLERKRPNKKLYSRLCDRVLNLEEVFANSDIDDMSLANIVINKLEPKKNQGTAAIKPTEHKKNHTIPRKKANLTPIDPTPERDISHITLDKETRKVTYMNMLPNIVPKAWLKALQNNKWIYKYTRQYSVALIFLIILLFRRLKLLSRWFGNVPQFISQVKPALLELLRLLSSI